MSDTPDATSEHIENCMADCGDGRRAGWWNENFLDGRSLLIEIEPGGMLISCCEGERTDKRINFIIGRAKAIEITRAMMKALGIGAEAIDTKDWRPTSEAIAKPGTYIKVRTTDVMTYRWLAYKKDGARQMKAAGRWQRATEYGWENAPLPVGEFVVVPEEK